MGWVNNPTHFSHIMTYMVIILICLVVLLAILTIYAFMNRNKVNKEVEQQNQQLSQKKDELQREITTLECKEKELSLGIDDLRSQTSLIQQDAASARAKADAARKELDAISNTIYLTEEQQKQLAMHAFSSYCDTLEVEYCKKDEEFNTKMQNLASSFEQEQTKLQEIKATRAAAQQALLKEQEIKENKDNYRLIPTENDLSDIVELERVKRNLHKPRILSMLIWSTFWQPLAKVKFPQILQAKTKCGIYKITNTQTDECYIGQSVDVYKRWNDHCKCGLGIDTPPGNKLYKAIQDYGLENFTFELLAECTKEELDAKEKYFIELYQAKEFGYNGRNEGVR